ncbi:NAD-glutamate dehydrogenase [Brevundimonas sp. 2R-24]|uniref:NAD-glutamate dehydrogenase n=1 Tax=Peiella sedimenti TaxID=3061083 RepID=A0ABT8SKM7_9CAUL|nr:NAD-glutamate dehydrogenase [Caulobacteraceae bacterium XZ-24]
MIQSKIRKAFVEASGAGAKLTAPAELFLTQALEDHAADETPELSLEATVRELGLFWKRAHAHDPAVGPDIRTRRVDGCPYDLIEIVQADGPFLVDSVMGELTAQNVSARAMYHPVVEIDGKRLSFIMVVIDTLTEDRAAIVRTAVREALADVRAAVDDHAAMDALMQKSVADLKTGAAGLDQDQLDETVAFLEWLKGDHFVFLGAREYGYPRTKDGDYAAQAPLTQAKQGLGVLRDPNRAVLRRLNEPALLTQQLRARLDLSEPVIVAKANLRSRVHRRAYMDYVGVRRYGDDGKPSGEVRFVGLFTAEAYDRSAGQVPLIRRKVANALARAAKVEGSHSHKRLKNILENYPRDELFQISEDELLETALGILHLYDRPRVKLFTRKDPFDRFVSVLLFVPRDRYDVGVRQRVGRLLSEAWGGRISAFYPLLSDAPLVRVHYIVGVEPGSHPEPDLAQLEAAVAETSRSWRDRFEQAARDSGRADVAVEDLTERWADAFPAGFRDRYDADEALRDLDEIEHLDGAGDVGVRAFRAATDSVLQFRFKLYRRGGPAPLADVLPILDHMGLKALEESGHAVRAPDGVVTYVHEFLLEDPRGERLCFDEVRDPFEAAFAAAWSGETESDGFNRLVLELGVGWRTAALIRALARYRGQTGLDPSQQLQEEALADHPKVARLLLELWSARFDPDRKGSADDRAAASEDIYGRIIEALKDVASLDHDRVLRRLANLILAIKRTNFYQNKPHISFKIASRELEELPAPKPFREIFVWAPHVEGVHLRFGPVARGGLRWSDRRDDFRTEVLGLVKAQQVKNAVIVPVGSKGGFYPKCLPRGGAPDAVRAEAIRAYTTFLSGLLDVTDNIGASGEVIHPDRVVRWEGDDPYLVVAADKGTATFSDIANGISADYGFWLGDAFASGGSAGYDHKVMGITARGAWEAVKRHFREMGKDIQKQPFTAVGVGDMSGDVFGNGMLLSKQTRLLAAFDHRDIFVDPDPDPAGSWKERSRMFKLPRSSWQDYDRTKISKGGGVFSRSLKSIPISAEMKAALDITADALTPQELMRAILLAPAELLYLGGIGTYVRAEDETDLSVGDKANDGVRVTGRELRVQVVGEGANLGLTQAGRIEFARNGGRINTDAIDNSAGVDSSDHEVNIKILTGSVETAGKLTRPARNELLASMTDEVAEKVLAHNYDQTLALTLAEARAAPEMDAYAAFMARLEAAGRLNREVEGLPDAAATAELMANHRGLTRPELAVLLAYAKLELSEEIVASAAPEDPAFEDTLVGYFPEPLGRYEKAMKTHRLRREIIATVLCNDIVNRCGATFPSRLKAAAGCDTTAMVVAYEAARRIFRLDEAWDEVSALDNKAPAAAQTALYAEIALIQRRQTFWLARRATRGGADVKTLIKAYQDAADGLRAEGAGTLSDFDRQGFARRAQAFAELGAPRDLAKAVALLRPLTATSDVADLARAAKWPAPAMARLYHQVGAVFGFDRLRSAAGSLASADHFERMAVRRLIEDMLQEQAQLTRAVAATTKKGAALDGAGALAAARAWAEARPEAVDLAARTVTEIEQAGQGWSFAKLTIANAALRELAAAASG